MPRLPRVMMKLKVMDKDENQLLQELKFPHTPVENLVFIQIPNEKMKQMDILGQKEEFVHGLSVAAAKTEKTFVIVPEGTELLEIATKWELPPEEDDEGPLHIQEGHPDFS